MPGQINESAVFAEVGFNDATATSLQNAAIFAEVGFNDGTATSLQVAAVYIEVGFNYQESNQSAFFLMFP